MKTMLQEKIRIGFELSKDLLEKIKAKASEKELSYSEYLRQLIQDAVNKAINE